VLTDLKWLNRGEMFPPKCERERLEMYANNKALFEGEHADVYEEDLKRIERVMGSCKLSGCIELSKTYEPQDRRFIVWRTAVIQSR
jgi:hypothetical protein